MNALERKLRRLIGPFLFSLNEMDQTMKQSRYKTLDKFYPHFLTATFVRWLPFFSDPKISAICIDSLKYLHQFQGLRIYGWVFMENHAHFIARAPELSKAMANFKSYTARLVIDRFKELNRTEILDELAWSKTCHKKSQDYQLWQEGVNPKQIFSRGIMIKKLEYLHTKPVKQGYVDRPEHWRYSSMRDCQWNAGLLPVCCKWLG
jgi:REP element-mobilizing transposase RayT